MQKNMDSHTKPAPKKQFVVAEHTTPNGVHWDLMLEMDDCLWTWRLNTPGDSLWKLHNQSRRING